MEFPGRRRQARPETPDAAARRELAEEIGLVAPRLLRAGEATGIWNGWRYRVHFFELRLERLPQLQLDNREIIGARLASPEELRNMEVTGPIAAYLERCDRAAATGQGLGVRASRLRPTGTLIEGQEWTRSKS